MSTTTDFTSLETPPPAADKLERRREDYDIEIGHICAAIGAEQGEDVRLTLRCNGEMLPVVPITLSFLLDTEDLAAELEGQLEDVLLHLRRWMERRPSANAGLRALEGQS